MIFNEHYKKWSKKDIDDFDQLLRKEKKNISKVAKEIQDNQFYDWTFDKGKDDEQMKVRANTPLC